LVSKDPLPARYGGDAGDIYYHKPHTDASHTHRA
jgi:hypothetical protein